MSHYTCQEAKSIHIDRIGLKRASQEQYSDIKIMKIYCAAASARFTTIKL